MPQQIDEPAAWVLAAAEKLNGSGSWTGRIHIHKLLFITQILRLAAPPFKFVVHDYGPYSFDLDEEIAKLEWSGRLDHTYPKAGYGPRYKPTPQGRAAAKLSTDAASALGKVAGLLGNRNSQSLELLATALWVEKQEKITADEDIVSQVGKLKPKYNEDQVRLGLEDARKLVASLS